MTSECHLGAVLVDNRLQGATRNCLQLKQTKGGISVGVTIYFFFHVKKKKRISNCWSLLLKTKNLAATYLPLVLDDKHVYFVLFFYIQN